MNKRNSLLSLVLVLCLCFMFAVPALAAENEYEDNNYTQMNASGDIDNIAIINEVNFEPAKIDSLIISDDIVTPITPNAQNEQDEKDFHYEAFFDKGIVDVYTDDKNVTGTEVEEYVNMANNAIKQEIAIAKAKNETIPDIIFYQFTDGDIQIACEAGTNKISSYATDDDFFVQEIDIFDNVSIDDEINIFDSMSITQAVPNGFENSMGIRQMAYGDGQYMTATIANCPPLNVDKTVNGVANKSYGYYHYIGFEGTYEKNEYKSDMGLLYSSKKNGWLPYMKVNQLGKSYMIFSDNEIINNVGYVLNNLGDSAYGMTSPITITSYKYVPGYANGQNNGPSTVRCTIKGTRISPLEQNIMCIAEAGTGVNVSTTWRVLTTITNSSNFPPASNALAPRMEMNYSNVKIGTQLVKWNTSSANNALVRARITKINEAGSVQGKVNFN